MTTSYIGIDWGSSNLRAFYIRDGRVQASISLEKGVKRIGSQDEYPKILNEIIQSFEADTSTPLLLSGMVGGAAGWIDTPYSSCPMELQGLDKQLIPLAHEGKLANPVYHFPGLSIANDSTQEYDVMRGEEVQIIGALSLDSYDHIVLPGTHSKWVNIEGGKTPNIRSFTTVITGELYELLLNQSLLGSGANKSVFSNEGFGKGIDEGDRSSNIIESLFLSRSRLLLNRLNEEEVAGFLSGMLITNEIKEKLPVLTKASKVAFIGAPALLSLYKRVLEHYQIDNVHFLSSEEVTIAGYNTIMNGNLR